MRRAFPHHMPITAVATIDSKLLGSVTGAGEGEPIGPIYAGIGAGGAAALAGLAAASHQRRIPHAMAGMAAVGAGCSAASGDHPLVVAASGFAGGVPYLGAVTNSIQCARAGYKALR